MRKQDIYQEVSKYVHTADILRTPLPIYTSHKDTLHPSLLSLPMTEGGIHGPISLSLALDNRRPGVDIAGRHGPVQLEENARVGGLVGAGEGHERARVERAGAARHRDLRARDVQLRAAHAACAVQRDVLHAEEVLAVGDARGDLDRDLGFACANWLLVSWLCVAGVCAQEWKGG